MKMDDKDDKEMEEKSDFSKVYTLGKQSKKYIS